MAADLSHLLSVDKIKHKWQEMEIYQHDSFLTLPLALYWESYFRCHSYKLAPLRELFLFSQILAGVLIKIFHHFISGFKPACHKIQNQLGRCHNLRQWQRGVHLQWQWSNLRGYDVTRRWDDVTWRWRKLPAATSSQPLPSGKHATA